MMATYKFNASSARAAQLVAEVFTKIKEIWDPDITDDSVAQFAVALVAKGYDRRKLTSNLTPLLGEGAASMLLDWCGMCWWLGALPPCPHVLQLRKLVVPANTLLPQAATAPQGNKERAGAVKAASVIHCSRACSSSSRQVLRLQHPVCKIGTVIMSAMHPSMLTSRAPLSSCLLAGPSQQPYTSRQIPHSR
jgi:hypothetical protein